MAKIRISTTSSFDFLTFIQDMSAIKGAIKNTKDVDSNTVSLKLNGKYTLLFDGDFNGNLTEPDIDRVTVVYRGEKIMEITDVEHSLLTLLALGKLVGEDQEGIGGAIALMGAMLTEEGTYISGNKGADTLLNIASTRFFGGAGNDVLLDQAGQDNHFDGETGADTVTYTGDDQTLTGVKVNLADASQNTGNALGDTYRSIENILGTDYDDILIGTKSKNSLLGGNGSDTLIGGAGSDKLFGDDGLDYASYETSLTGVTVDLSFTDQNTGDAAGDKYKDIEGIKGSALADDLTGNSGANVIYGNAGDDVLHGAGGSDILWGDSEEFGVDGADNFYFSGPGNGVVAIMDFDVFDHIQISRTGFGLHPLYVLNVGAQLIISHANPTSVTNSPTFLVEQSTGNLYFDADGNGSGGKELIANVQFHSQEYLDINDFIIV